MSTELITPQADTSFITTKELANGATRMLRELTRRIGFMAENGLISPRTIISATADLTVMAIKVTDATIKTGLKPDELDLSFLNATIEVLREEANNVNMELPDLSFPWETGEEE